MLRAGETWDSEDWENEGVMKTQNQPSWERQIRVKITRFLNGKMGDVIDLRKTTKLGGTWSFLF